MALIEVKMNTSPANKDLRGCEVLLIIPSVLLFLCNFFVLRSFAGYSFFYLSTSVKFKKGPKSHLCLSEGVCFASWVLLLLLSIRAWTIDYTVGQHSFPAFSLRLLINFWFLDVDS